ncbi:G-type lectin S-receptor-like serine/threonine-protein kinase SD2-5 [Tanacetum coccineum]
MPVRFTYKNLQEATNGFTTKLGRGGFGSVYQGVLKDGTRVAVKRLEGIGQGKKEFRAEVSMIGSIRHHHLVKLKGYNIAIGTKLHGLRLLSTKNEDCDVKIVHCDIKPENVLLDDNFLAKISDFGLAKLMTREQSHVFTTLRGTRGYLAPEWITNHAISEKSDVYSYGMVLLEIISGQKNYAFKIVDEGKVEIHLDKKVNVDENDERAMVATRVALWCIQDDMSLRPSMTKVVQMLEGLCTVPPAPVSGQTGPYSSLYRSFSQYRTFPGPSDGNTDASLSDMRLSGPR